MKWKRVVATLILTMSLYPSCGIVTRIEGNRVEYQEFNGNVFSFCSEDGDFDVGDIVSVIMDSKGTPLVYDDEVLDARYCGYMMTRTY